MDHQQEIAQILTEPQFAGKQTLEFTKPQAS